MFRCLIVLSVVLTAGCDFVADCINPDRHAQPIPIPETYKVEVVFDGQQHMKVLRCEEYYDNLGCTFRGNYWTVRDVGKNNYSQRSEIAFAHNTLGNVSIKLPTCKSLVAGRTTPLNHLYPRIDGQTYVVRTRNNVRRLELSDIPKTSTTDPAAPIHIAVDYSISVNGKALTVQARSQNQ